MGRKIGMTDKEYLKSGVWKCSSSPTGAHHWMQMTESERLRTRGYFRCKYCGDIKTFQVGFSSYNYKEIVVKPHDELVNIATTL